MEIKGHKKYYDLFGQLKFHVYDEIFSLFSEKSAAVLQVSLASRTMKKNQRFTRKDGEIEGFTITRNKSNQRNWKKEI